MKTKKRPGVEASIHLAAAAAAADSIQIWLKVEEQYKELVVQSIRNLDSKEAAVQQLQLATKEHLTKTDLDKIAAWKHTVGMNRVYNLKHLNSNTEKSIVEQSKIAIAAAKKIDFESCFDDDHQLNKAGRDAMSKALGELTKLKGVGPATATAILTNVRPDLFCYMYDEVIDTFEPQRDYTMPVYLRINARCLEIARSLGGDWTTSRVAKALWTAARVLVITGQDIVETDTSTATDGKRKATSQEDAVKSKKRSRAK